MGYFLSSKLYHSRIGVLVHWCPGCKERHSVYIDEAGHNNNIVWSFNGDYEKPTFSPSVKHSTNVPRTIEELTKPVTYVKCHYSITDGMIIYCNDSMHEFAGKSIPLPCLPTFNEG